VSLIREFCGEFNVIIPYRAFSAATLTALGANNIYMHPMGILGPTDPSVMNDFNPANETNPQQKIGINVEDVYSYIDLVKNDLGITHDDELIKAWSYLASENRIHPLALGNVKRFYSQSRMMTKKLLEMHMDKVKDAHTIEKISDSLNSKLYYHGHPINMQEAKDLGLKVKQLTPKLQKAVWDLYLDYEKDMKLEEPFIPEQNLKEVTPDYPTIYVNLNQMQGMASPNSDPAKLDIKVIATCAESVKESHILTAGFGVVGYKILGPPGLQEHTELYLTSQKWVKTMAPASP
jgi:hypothetical protein